MGTVISLAERREARQSGGAAQRRAMRPRAAFFFDLASPYTYLGAERVDRTFAGIEWRPAFSEALYGGDPAADTLARERAQLRAEARAVALRMPLVWPERYPTVGRAAMRVASLAGQEGRAAPFVLAASRLAFCGGFDLEDPEILAEAAAAAGLGLDACLVAAAQPVRDGEMVREGRRLLAWGGDGLPALRIGRTLFCGEDRIADAAAAWRASGEEARRAPFAG